LAICSCSTCSWTRSSPSGRDAGSGLLHRKTLEEFDFAFQPDLDPCKIRDLASLTFVEGKSTVVFLGPPGVGKTMLAVAVAACQAGLSIYYTTFDDLVRQLSIAEAAGRYPKKLQTHLPRRC
jgi:DNA replication protein DnaC